MHTSLVLQHATKPCNRWLVQREGETVFVPEGFRHAVLNEELAVAVTHNVAPPSAVERMLPLAADVCPAFAQRVEARRKKRRRGREVTIEGPYP